MKTLESLLSADYDVEVLSLADVMKRVYTNKLTEQEIQKMCNVSFKPGNPNKDARTQFVTIELWHRNGHETGITIYWDDIFTKGTRSNAAFKINITYQYSLANSVSYWVNTKGKSWVVEYDVDTRRFLETLMHRNFSMRNIII